MSEVRSWSAPAQQLSGQPTVDVTDKLNSLISIRSKTPLYLVMTDQSASTASTNLRHHCFQDSDGNSTKKKSVPAF